MGPRTRGFGELAPRIFDPLDLAPEIRIRILAMLNNFLYGFVHREIAWSPTRERTGLTAEQWSTRVRSHVDRERQEDPDFAEPWEPMSLSRTGRASTSASTSSSKASRYSSRANSSLAWKGGAVEPRWVIAHRPEQHFLLRRLELPLRMQGGSAS